MLKKSKFKKIMATSIMALMMAGAIDSGILGMKQIYVHAATVESAQAQQDLRMPVSTQTIDEAIEKAANAVQKTHYSMDWTVIGLDRAEKGSKINKNDYLKKVVEYLSDEDNQNLFENRPTEYERITLGVLAVGGDPTNVNESGINLIDKICKAKLEKQGINALVFGLIALDAQNYSKTYKIPETKKEEIIKAILKKQVTDGGWAFFGKEGDPDMTGMAMTALGKHKDSYPDVANAIEKAKKYLHEKQLQNGGFQSWGTENSESCAQVIMGLCAIGENPAEFKKYNGKNVVDALLDFQDKSTGAFKHILGTEDNGMATEQALYALDQYKFHLKGKGSIYDWEKNPSSVK